MIFIRNTFFLFLVLLVSACNPDFKGGEISLRLDGFPLFISEKISEVYATEGLLIIELSEADSMQLKLYAEEVHVKGDLLDAYINEDIYVEGIVIAPSAGAPWSEIKLPLLDGAVELFEQNGIKVKYLKIME